MPMIDIYAVKGTFSDPVELAKQLPHTNDELVTAAREEIARLTGDG